MRRVCTGTLVYHEHTVREGVGAPGVWRGRGRGQGRGRGRVGEAAARALPTMQSYTVSRWVTAVSTTVAPVARPMVRLAGPPTRVLDIRHRRHLGVGAAR